MDKDLEELIKKAGLIGGGVIILVELLKPQPSPTEERFNWNILTFTVGTEGDGHYDSWNIMVDDNVWWEREINSSRRPYPNDNPLVLAFPAKLSYKIHGDDVNTPVFVDVNGSGKVRIPNHKDIIVSPGHMGVDSQTWGKVDLIRFVNMQENRTIPPQKVDWGGGFYTWGDPGSTDGMEFIIDDLTPTIGWGSNYKWEMTYVVPKKERHKIDASAGTQSKYDVYVVGNPHPTRIPDSTSQVWYIDSLPKGGE